MKKQCLYLAVASALTLACFTGCAKEKVNVSETKISETKIVETETEVIETEVAETETVIVPMSLSEDEQYEINIFLSNFSEQGFNMYNEVEKVVVTEDFHVDHANVNQLVQFAFEMFDINIWNELSFLDGGDSMALTVDQVCDKVNRYFALTLTPEDVAACGYAKEGNYVKKPYAVGDSHPEFTIVSEMLDQGDGTYLAKFKIFVLEEAATGGNMVADKSVYAMTEAEANAADGVSYYGYGKAVVKPYQVNGKDSYQLIAYKVVR